MALQRHDEVVLLLGAPAPVKGHKPAFSLKL